MPMNFQIHAREVPKAYPTTISQRFGDNRGDAYRALHARRTPSTASPSRENEFPRILLIGNSSEKSLVLRVGPPHCLHSPSFRQGVFFLLGKTEGTELS